MPCKISEVHRAFTVKLNAIGGAPLRQRDKKLSVPIRFYETYGSVTFEINDVKIAVFIKSRAFNIIGENIFFCEILNDKKAGNILCSSLNTDQGQDDEEAVHRVEF